MHTSRALILSILAAIGSSITPYTVHAVILADVEIDGTTSATVLNQSGSDVIIVDPTNAGDIRMTVNGAMLKQSEGVIIAVPTKLAVESTGLPRQVINIAGELTGQSTLVPPGGSFATGMWFVTNDISGAGGAEANYDFAFAHFAFDDGWIAGTVAGNGAVMAGNTSAVTITKRSGTGLNSGNYSLEIAGVNPSTDGYLFPIGASNETGAGTNSSNYVNARIKPDNSGWDLLSVDQGDDADDGVAGEDQPFSFVYLSKDKTSNLIAGRVADNASVLDAIGDFDVSQTGTGQYFLQISDGEGGFFGKDDGVLLMSVIKDALNFDGPDDNFLLQQYDPLNQGFLINSYDLASAPLQNTSWQFAFLQFNAAPAVVPEPGTLALLTSCVPVAVWIRRKSRRNRRHIATLSPQC